MGSSQILYIATTCIPLHCNTTMQLEEVALYKNNTMAELKLCTPCLYVYVSCLSHKSYRHLDTLKTILSTTSRKV